MWEHVLVLDEGAGQWHDICRRLEHAVSNFFGYDD